jgi:hypothetical protein
MIMPNPFDQSGSEQPQNNQFEDKTPEEFMSELVGEGKKYATPEEAVRALAHANHHISNLEGENANFRTKLDKASTVDDILGKLKQQGAESGSDTGVDDQSNQPPKADDVNVEELVKKLFQDQQSNATAQSNKKLVVDKMAMQFGGKAGQVWDGVEKNLGVDLEQLCATSPTAALKLLGVTGEAQQGDSGGSFQGKTPPPSEARPPEGSKRLVEHMLSKNEITRKQAYNMKLKFSADPEKYNA